jgi:hypothetical protein
MVRFAVTLDYFGADSVGFTLVGELCGYIGKKPGYVQPYRVGVIM